MGDIMPMLAAMAVAPAILSIMGSERLGVLSLIWVLIGYFSFLDLGLGRAITVEIASIRTSDANADLKTTGTALIALAGLGSLGAVILAIVASFSNTLLGLSSPAFAEEVHTAALLMIPSLPILLATAAFRGHLEGLSAFRALNLVRIPSGILLSVAPLATAQFTPELPLAVLAMLLVRVAQLLALAVTLAHHRSLPWANMLNQMARGFQPDILRRLFSFGGWVTVSSIIGPVIVYADRFFIGLMLGAATIPLYTIPFDAISKLPILVASACSVLLPEMVRLSAPVTIQNSAVRGISNVLTRVVRLTGAIAAACAIAGWFLLPSFMTWWMGPAFAEEVLTPTRILLLAFAVNALGQIPCTGLLAMSQTRIIAMIHIVQLIPYLLCLWWLTSLYGVAGAATACLGRAVVDFFLMLTAAKLCDKRLSQALRS